MPDSTLKTIAGIAAVGAAGVGAYYLIKKKAGSALEPVITPIVTTVNEIKEINEGTNEIIKEITSSNRPNSTVIVEDALENAGINDAPELLKYNLMPGNITAANVGLSIFSDTIANFIQGAIDSLTGSPAASDTPIINNAVNDKDELREAADNKPVKVTDKTTSTIPAENVPVTTPAPKATDATQIATVTTTPTPITEVPKVTTAGQSIIQSVRSAVAAADATRSERTANVGAGKTVTGIKSDNKFVGEILKKYGYTVTSKSYV